MALNGLCLLVEHFFAIDTQIDPLHRRKIDHFLRFLEFSELLIQIPPEIEENGELMVGVFRILNLFRRFARQ